MKSSNRYNDRKLDEEREGGREEGKVNRATYYILSRYAGYRAIGHYNLVAGLMSFVVEIRLRAPLGVVEWRGY
jgi:hypothetical protein